MENIRVQWTCIPMRIQRVINRTRRLRRSIQFIGKEILFEYQWNPNQRERVNEL